jgi:hypothetical protein
MAYLDIDDNGLLNDIINRKEFFSYKDIHKYEPESDPLNDNDVIPINSLQRDIETSSYIQFNSYQNFVKNFLNINTPYSRLLLKHSTGSGKTISAIGVAIQYIDYYNQMKEANVNQSIGSVYIIAFEGARKAFQKDLLNHQQFGFANNQEIRTWNELKKKAMFNNPEDIEKATDWGNRLKKRLNNRVGRGFFKFMGYKTLFNKLFINEKNSNILSSLSGNEIKKLIASNKIKYNVEFLDEFKNSLFICDEIHNVYNSNQKNNWGAAIQIILDKNPSMKTLLLSATPINNNPSEIIDLMNLLIPESMRIYKKDFFDNKKIIPGTINKLKDLSIGRISYLINKDVDSFPSRSFNGVSIEGIKYLKFVRCEMTKKQTIEYFKVYDKEQQTIPQEYKLVVDFIIPAPDGKFVYRQSDIKKLQNTDSKWLLENNISFTTDNNLTGTFLQVDNLINVSSKYHKMLTDIFTNIKTQKGKMLIFHNNVKMSGVLFIREILIQNGILDEFSNTAPNTMCSICGVSKKNHIDPIILHEFKPVRFVLIHGEVDKNSIDISISKYNDASNSMGENFMIMIGSRVIKESYDLKAVRNILILSRPDNASMIIQIIGRAVRKNSHILLPLDMRHVFINIYTSSLPSGGLSYEELKYKDKMEDYSIIQKIEKIFHENAIDAPINYAKIRQGLIKDDLGDLEYTPAIFSNPLYKKRKESKQSFTLDELNLNTFYVYHNQEEINLTTYIIKRIFIETSPAWIFEDLKKQVRSPKFSVEYNTSIISDESIIISLSKLLWEKNSIGSNNIRNVSKQSTQSYDIIDKLFDYTDKRIFIPGNSTIVDGSARGDGSSNLYGVGEYGIIQVGIYYILTPLNQNSIIVYTDSPYRKYKQTVSTSISVSTYLKNNVSDASYVLKKEQFRKEYEQVEISGFTDIVCKYGLDFHLKFVEETIEYIFNNWTDWTTKQSELHMFYFKILYYYDIVGLIIFANTTRSHVYSMYEKYIIEKIDTTKNNITDNGVNNALTTFDNSVDKNIDNRNLLNSLARTISKAACSWCPKITKELYDKALDRSLKRFDLVKVKQSVAQIVKVPSDLLPVGHFIKNTPRFYLPDKGWFTDYDYINKNDTWIENPIIIGYNVKSATGIHIRFKLRKPIQNKIIYKDSRLTEKGSICITRSKDFLISLCKKLKIKYTTKSSVISLCDEVKSRLMYLELLERSRGSKLKFFYSHFETTDL